MKTIDTTRSWITRARWRRRKRRRSASLDGALLARCRGRKSRHGLDSNSQRREHRFGIGDGRWLGEARRECAHRALEVGVVAAAFGLHADRDEHVGLRVLRIGVAV